MNQRPQELHLEQRRRQVERAAGIELAELLQKRLQLEPAMLGRVRRQPPERLGQLALGADAPAAPGLVPRDGDVHEALEEVAFVLRRRAPGVLELLVRGEVLAGADQLDAAKEPTRRFRREGGRAVLVRPSNPRHWVGCVRESSLRLDLWQADANF